MKVREAIRLVEEDGWRLVATRGSHRQYKHPVKPGRVTIAAESGATRTPVPAQGGQQSGDCGQQVMAA